MALNFIILNVEKNRVGGELKTIRNTNKAQGNIAGFFITMMLATIVALAVAWPAIDQAINGNVGYATNSIISQEIQLLVNILIYQRVWVLILNLVFM